MNCPEGETVEKFINGMLTEPEEKELMEHVRECVSCHTIYEELKSVDELLALCVTNEPSSDYWKNLSEQIKNKESEKSGNFNMLFSIAPKVFWGVTEIAAALIIIILISFFNLNEEKLLSHESVVREIWFYINVETEKTPNQNIFALLRGDLAEKEMNY